MAALAAGDVEVVFGVASVHNLPIYDALARHGGIRIVPARSEYGAVGMADGCARATGRLGVAITSTGVAAANAAGPLLEAYGAGSPLLHLTGQVPAAYLDQERGVLHAAKDQGRMLRAVGRGARRVRRTEDIPRIVAGAIEAALSGSRGPVSVEIPIDQQWRRVAVPDVSVRRPAARAPDPAQVELAARLLGSARRPLFWVGGGAVAAEASEPLLRLAERLGAGVVTTNAGRGVVPEDHPLCIGNFALDPAVSSLLATGDVLLAVGTRFRSNETRNWALRLPPHVVQVDVDRRRIGQNYPVEAPVVGDARLALWRLADRAKAGQPEPGWTEAVARAGAEARARLRTTLGPYEMILDALRAGLPQRAIVVRDVTVPATAWGSRLLEAREARGSLHSASFSMGLGLVTAIGAAVGRPDRPIVLLTGDGGLGVAVGELATAAQEGLDLTIVAFNDRGYGVLRNLQDAHCAGRRISVDLASPDLVALARSFGLWAERVTAAERFAPVVGAALAQSRGPRLVEVDMDAVGPMRVPFTGAAPLVAKSPA